MNPASGGRAQWFAFAWGLAESTFFFLVPDVLSTRLVLQDRRAGFAACASSLGGALLGGFLLFMLGRNPATAGALLQAFDFIPGIRPESIEQARLGLAQQGAWSLFAGFIGGIPYKLYAVQAPGAGIGLLAFLAASTAARLGRFLLTTTVAWALGRLLLRKITLAAVFRIHAGSWTLFYCIYFWRMGL